MYYNNFSNLYTVVLLWIRHDELIYTYIYILENYIACLVLRYLFIIFSIKFFI